VAGLWFPKCAHVLDPLEVVRAFATAAVGSGARIERRNVKALTVAGDHIMIESDGPSITVQSAIVCAGAWSAPLLRPFGLRVPLEAARGYHVEMPGALPLVDAPVLYSNQNIMVTPMSGRLRASSYMEFAGTEALQDPRKPERLRAALGSLGYSPPPGASWVGPRPVLPDYLPAMGQVKAVPNLAYAFGHQHIGLTLSGVTARAMADLMGGRAPRVDISAFDLRRFG
jgi:D-amino-acid dehydrogenase